MKVKIEAKNAEAITAAILEAEGRAKSFCLTADEILDVIARVENETALRYLQKGQHKGAVLRWAPSMSLPNSYKYTPSATAFTAERRSSGWFLTGVSRVSVNLKQSERMALTITQTQSDEIHSRIRSTYSVAA